MKKVMIVEDDRKIAVALGARLRAAGYDVYAAYDAATAVGAARKYQPDLILMDIQMPGGDGVSLTGRIQRVMSNVGVPVIFLTASKEADLKERALAAGGSAFFEKPYDGEELLDAISQLIGAGMTSETTA